MGKKEEKSPLKASEVLGPFPRPPRRHRGRLSKNARKAFKKRCAIYKRMWKRVQALPHFKRITRGHLQAVDQMHDNGGFKSGQAVPKSTSLAWEGAVMSWRRIVGNWHPRRRRAVSGTLGRAIRS